MRYYSELEPDQTRPRNRGRIVVRPRSGAEWCISKSVVGAR